MSSKEFDRSICFTFFNSYKKTAEVIEEQFGAKAALDYYNAIIDYALYGIEPELDDCLVYAFHRTKVSIDSSIKKRNESFNNYYKVG